MAPGGAGVAAGADARAACLLASGALGSQLLLRSASAASCSGRALRHLVDEGHRRLGHVQRHGRAPTARPSSRPTIRPITKPPRCVCASAFMGAACTPPRRGIRPSAAVRSHADSSMVATHADRCRDAEHRETVAQHLARCGQQRHAGTCQRRVVDQKTLGRIVRVKARRHLAEVEREVVRRKLVRRLAIASGKRASVRISAASLGAVRRASSASLASKACVPCSACHWRQHRADARVCVLHVEHRVVVVALERQVDVEHELGVRPCG